MIESIERDAQEFGIHVRQDKWRLGFLVARNVKPSRGGAGEHKSNRPKSAGYSDKVSMNDFAKVAGVARATVQVYFRTWERAAREGVVPPAEDLSPGKDIELDAEALPDWKEFYVHEAAPKPKIDEEPDEDARDEDNVIEFDPNKGRNKDIDDDELRLQVDQEHLSQLIERLRKEYPMPGDPGHPVIPFEVREKSRLALELHSIALPCSWAREELAAGATLEDLEGIELEIAEEVLKEIEDTIAQIRARMPKPKPKRRVRKNVRAAS